MSFDRVKVSKVETILAGLTPDEQRHIAVYLNKIVVPVAPGTAVSPPSIHAAANARIGAFYANSAAPAAPRANAGFTRFNMHQLLRRGDLIEFTDRSGHAQRARISSINTKTVSCESVTGSGTGWRVPPHMLRLVGQHPPLPATTMPIPAATSAHVPTAPGAGNW